VNNFVVYLHVDYRVSGFFPFLFVNIFGLFYYHNNTNLIKLVVKCSSFLSFLTYFYLLIFIMVMFHNLLFWDHVCKFRLDGDICNFMLLSYVVFYCIMTVRL
jgi:hypothetical protein